MILRRLARSEFIINRHAADNEEKYMQLARSQESIRRLGTTLRDMH